MRSDSEGCAGRRAEPAGEEADGGTGPGAGTAGAGISDAGTPATRGLLGRLAAELRRRVRLDRRELGGALGDVGTDFPLVAGMILSGGLDAASVLVMFGAMQVFAGLAYGLPMPAQPLKAVAVIVIAGGVTPEVLYGGGLAIGAFMLLLTATGLITWLNRVIPEAVIRGIQLGLGLVLAELALGDYVQAGGSGGYLLAGAAFLLVVVFSGSRRLPAALPVIALGVAWALVAETSPGELAAGAGLALPEARVPSLDAVVEGFLVLGLAQIPLSLGNSVFATRQLAEDLFPDRSPDARRIGLTYSLMNLVNPFLSGIPTCHGSGGLAGHHAFGARTGGSAVIYGAMFLVLGVFLSGAFDQVVHLFPLPVLGVILLVEALALMRLVGKVTADRFDLGVALLVGLAALTLPYGFLVGLVGGTALWYAPELSERLRWRA